MKILHIFHHSDLKNGVDKTTCTLIDALKKLGHQSSAVIPSTGDVSRYLDQQQIPYQIIPYHCCSSLAWRAGFRFFAESQHYSAAISDLIQQCQIDIVHLNTGHLLHAGLAAAVAKVPSIWHIHAPFDNDLTRYQQALGEPAYAELLEQLSSQIIGVSKDVCDSLNEKLAIPERIHTLYNGVDIKALQQAATKTEHNLRQQLKLPEQSKLIIGIGRVSRQKNFTRFVEVAAKICQNHADIFFIIAGPLEETAAVNQLQTRITELNLTQKVFLLGARNDVPSLISQSQLFLSTAIFEGHPLTSLEAMALDIPVVAMNCLGLRECVIDEVTGLLVELNNETAAAKAIQRLLTDKKLYQKLQQQAKHSVINHFSSEDYAKQFLNIAKIAQQFGSAPIKDSALALLQGLLKEIDTAHQQLLAFEQQTIKQRLSLLIRQIFQKKS